jgi:PKD domain-containing protein
MMALRVIHKLRETPTGRRGDSSVPFLDRSTIRRVRLQVALQLHPCGLRHLRGSADDGSVATTSPLLPLRAAVSIVALVLSLALVLLFSASPAGAFVTTVEGTNVGLQPRSTQLFDGLRFNLMTVEPEVLRSPEEFANNNGNPIVNSSKVYAIYWDPTDHYHGDWQHVIDVFLQSMGAASETLDNVFAVDAQYTDKENKHALYKSTFQGAYTDTDAYPTSGCKDPQPLHPGNLIGPEVGKNGIGEPLYSPVCLTDQQIQKELESFIAQHSLGRGMETIFYLLTPPAVTVCLDQGGNEGHCSDFLGTIAEAEAKEKEQWQAKATKKSFVEPESLKSYKNSFCSYHSAIDAGSSSGGENTILYGVIPWTAGGLGDTHLDHFEETDELPAYDCQDGGYDPSSKPVEKREEKKEKTAQEITEAKNKTLKQQEEAEDAEKLEGPHQQEPNQVKCPSPDGGCDTGLADLIVNQIAVEQQNIVTDPLLNAWQDPVGSEATDECRDWFAPILGGNVGAQEEADAGTLFNQVLVGNDYYLNTAFNLAALKLPYPGVRCLPGVSLLPQFTVPNTINAGEIVGFDGMESDITLNADTVFSPAGEPHTGYATYTWNFGDGSAPVAGFAPGAPLVNSPGVSPCGAAQWEAPCAASAYHSYKYGGIYEVTLTVTDVGGNTASVKEPVTVVGPPEPKPEPPPPPAPAPAPAPATTTPGGSANSGSSGGSSGTGPPSTTTPPPVLGASVTSKSLKKALSSGLPVRYSTNEQVAGNIEVLLESSTAKRLGIKGATATGLPAGTPKSIVVGTAVLVTTKAGQGTIRVKFTSRAAARLKHVHKLKVTLRLFARNASRQAPQTTTMFSTVVLNP